MKPYLFISFISILYCTGVELKAQKDSFPEDYDLAKDAYWEGDYHMAETLFINHLEWLDNHPREDKTRRIKTLTKLGDTYRHLRLFHKSLKYYGQAMQLAKTDDRYREWYLDAANNRSYVYSKMYEPLKAIRETNALMPITAELYGKESSDYANLHMNNGIDYYKSGDYYRSTEAFLKALAIFREVSDPYSEDFNRIYNNLGGNYRKIGDYEKALDYAEKALEIKLKNYPPDHPSVAKYHMNIGKVYSDMGESEKALPYLERALEIEQLHYPDDHPDVTGMKGELANVLADLGQYEKALEYYFTTESVDPRYIADDHPYMLAMYSNVAQVYLETGRYDAALEMHQKAVQKLERRGYVPPNKRTEMLWLLASIYDARGDTELAVEITVDGLRGLAPDFTAATAYQLPEPEQVIERKLFLDLSDQLIFFYEKLASQNSGVEYNKYALQAAEISIRLIELLRTSYHSDNARRTLQESSSDIYEAAVRNSFVLFEESGDYRFLKRAFEFSEASKANILKQVLNEGLALRSAGIPEATMDSMDQLKIRISNMKDMLTDKLIEGTPERDFDSIRSRLFIEKENYQALLRELEEQYPEYYELRFSSRKIDVAALQARLLDRSSSLVSYFYDSSFVYLFFLNGDSLFGYKTDHEGKLAENIEKLRSFLTPQAALKASEKEMAELAEISSGLYNDLIGPIIADGQWDETGSLIVVPHGVLYYLSFDLLHPPIKSKDPRDRDYLIRKVPLYYIPSTELWMRRIVNTENSQKPFTGFAPSYDRESSGSGNRSGYSQLNWNVPEVEKAQSFFRGESYSGRAATEEVFRDQAPAAGILHLAMHTEINDLEPMRTRLVFTPGADTIEDGFLNLYEVYNLRIPAETVVMNACNTGYGKLSEGEGVLSLAHAFSYAGCQSLVMNLWLADDQSSSRIITSFYENIDGGKSKDEALRSAKLEYLDKADRLRAHPYFWAGLVLQGDVGNQTGIGKLFYWLVIPLLLVIFIITLQLTKRSNPFF